MPANKASTDTAFEGTALEMAAEIIRMAEEQKATRAALFTQFTARIFDEFPKLNRVTIQGYTPGFNDGDPCTHSQQTYVSVSDFNEFTECDEDYDESLFQYTENRDSAYTDRYVLAEGVDSFPFNGDLTTEEIGEVRSAFDAFGEAIEDLYTTDFTLEWKRSKDDGKITFSHEHYDCGF